MQKELEKNFDRVAINNSYNDFAKIQKDSAQSLIEMFYHFTNHEEKIHIKKILDIGTGTGFIPEILLKKHPNSFYFLNDISKEMLKIASLKFHNKNYSLIHGDIEKIILKDSYDLIISNFSFQWMEDLKKLIKFFIENKKTKHLIFTTLVDNTFQEIKKIFQKYQIQTIEYLSSEELDYFIKSQNIIHFFSQKKTYNLNFENFYQYAQYIKNIGANFTKNKTSNLKTIIQYENSSIHLNYEVYFCYLKIF
jgi:malonyl-CoA O-methyltransferase